MKPIFRAFAAIAVSIFALATTGCASLAFKPGVQSVGEYKNTAAVASSADDLSAKDAAPVKVLLQALPEGMALKDHQLLFDHDRYELLGKVSADYKDPSLVNMGFWAYGYKETERWRTGLCVWQVPLSWATLTLWSWLSPTYYPCRVGAGEEEDRRAEIVATLQRTTKALGGDLVVVAGFGGVDFITVQGQTVVATNSVGTLSGVGYAFKTKGAASTSAPTAKGATSI